MQHSGLLTLAAFLPIRQRQRVGSPVALFVTRHIVVVHIQRQDTLLTLKHFLVLRHNLVVLVIRIFMDVTDGCRLVRQRATHQPVLAIILVTNVAVPLLLRHLRATQIAVAVVVALRQVGLFQLAVLCEAHELLLADGILRHHFLYRSV